jgi:hypothetical protein
MLTTITAYTSRRFARPLLYGLAAVALLTLAPREARADNIVITLDRSFLERAAEDAIEATTFEDTHLYWGHVHGRRVEVTRKNSNTIYVDFDLAYAVSNFPDPEVDVDLQINFHCFYAEPDIKLAIPDVDVDVNFPWYIDVATSGLTWIVTTVADRFINDAVAHSQAIKEEVMAKVNETVDVPLTFCPDFNVTSSGDVQVIIGQGGECTNGQTKHRHCSGNYTGPGFDDLCINGYWETVGGWCEPKPPPGGQQP